MVLKPASWLHVGGGEEGTKGPPLLPWTHMSGPLTRTASRRWALARHCVLSFQMSELRHQERRPWVPHHTLMARS